MIEDLQRWSGLGKTALKQWISDCGEELQNKEIDGRIYYFASSWAKRSGVEGSQKKLWDVSMPLRFTQHDISLWKNTLTHFLAGFDERLLGYKDRSMTVHNNDLNKIDVSHNGVFKPTIMIDGVTVSIRSIKYKIKLTEITVTWFGAFNKSDISVLQKPIGDYAQHLAKKIKFTIV